MHELKDISNILNKIKKVGIHMRHVIELTMTDNDTVQTAINGTEQEIYNYYQENNRMAWVYSNKEEIVPQVKRIKFVESELLKNSRHKSKCEAAHPLIPAPL